MDETRDSVHLDHVLDVSLLEEALLGDGHLLVNLQLPVPLAAVWQEAAAKSLQPVDEEVTAVVGLELLLLLKFGDEDLLAVRVVDALVQELPLVRQILLSIQVLEHL